MPPTQTIDMPAPRDAVAPPDAPGPFLVACDGTEAATSALVIAKLLAAPDHVHLVSVLEPVPYAMPSPDVRRAPAGIDEQRIQWRRERLQAQASGIFGDAMPAIDVRVGSPIAELARAARECGASMVVTGLRHHTAIDRVSLHRETPLAVAKATRRPVLVVAPGTNRLPRVAMLAVDLDEASIHAARRARPLLGAVERVHLVHVRADDGTLSLDAAARREGSARELTESAFDRVVAALGLPETVVVERRVRAGHPVDEVLTHASRVRADLLVLGHRERRLTQRLLGPRSVAERVLRGAWCTVLFVPDVAGVELSRVPDADIEVVTDRATWPLAAAGFAFRNKGRRTHLELGSALTGVQAELDGYPLLGLEYDEGARTLQLTLGRAEPGAPRLRYLVPGMDALEIQRPRSGEDLALRVACGDEYLALTFDEPDRAA